MSRPPAINAPRTNGWPATGPVPLRVAIVGCGPRGLYALESLGRAFARSEAFAGSATGAAVEVVVFEPAPFPGAGQVYNPDQPEFLRMNFASRHIDAWQRKSADGAPCRIHPDQPAFVQWLGEHHPQHADPQGFAPRALVGEYLHHCFQQVIRELPARVRVAVRRQRVGKLSPAARGTWRVETRPETGFATTSIAEFDEVLLATGHGGWRESPVLSGDPLSGESPPKISEVNRHLVPVDSVFPVERNLGRQNVRPGATVAIRGFALTFIDAVLALTEGRGGAFGNRNGVWSYVPGGSEPGRIFPFSRTGRPMLAKPDGTRCQVPVQVEAVWQNGCETLRNLPREPDGIRFRGSLWPVILATAGAALEIVEGSGSRRNGRQAVADWLNRWTSCPVTAAGVRQKMQHSIDVATGRARPDAGWALAEAWRRLYPPLVERISHGGLRDAEWPDFGRMAAEMERIAFGPPAENLARLVALIDSGVVRLDHLRSSFDAERGCFQDSRSPGDSRRQDVDVLVQAVLPAPADHAADSPLASLLHPAALTCLAATGGIVINESARPVSGEGQPVRGLAILGRSTEGWVLGNDTLSRTLHRHPENWAADVLATTARRVAACP